MNCVHCGQCLCSTLDGHVLCSACIEREVDHKPALPDIELPKLPDVNLPRLRWNRWEGDK